MTQRTQSILEQFASVVNSPFGAFGDIAKLGRLLEDPQCNAQLLKQISATPEGAHALRRFPRLGVLDLQQMLREPPGTLAHEYARHMLDNGFDAPPALPAPDVGAYMIAHLTETHDIWHIVTGYNTDKPGECAIDGFYLAQLQPSPGLVGLLCKNMMKTAIEEPASADVNFSAVVHGWLLGKRARPLFGVDWTPLWQEPLTAVRARYGIDPAQVSRLLAM